MDAADLPYPWLSLGFAKIPACDSTASLPQHRPFVLASASDYSFMISRGFKCLLLSMNLPLACCPRSSTWLLKTLVFFSSHFQPIESCVLIWLLARFSGWDLNLVNQALLAHICTEVGSLPLLFHSYFHSFSGVQFSSQYFKFKISIPIIPQYSILLKFLQKGNINSQGVFSWYHLMISWENT